MYKLFTLTFLLARDKNVKMSGQTLGPLSLIFDPIVVYATYCIRRTKLSEETVVQALH